MVVRLPNNRLPNYFPYNNENSLNIPNPVNHLSFESCHHLSVTRQLISPVSRRQYDFDFNSLQGCSYSTKGWNCIHGYHISVCNKEDFALEKENRCQKTCIN